MKISQDTMNILKNFSQINTGLVFRVGNVLTTISPQKNILAEAKVKESFTKEFGIYDLPSFLSVLTLGKEDPEITYHEKHLTIKGYNDRSMITYRYTDPSMIVCPPDKKLKVPNSVASFDLTEADFAWVSRCASVLQSPNLSIEGDSSGLYLKTYNPKDTSAHIQKLQLSDESMTKFSFSLRMENLKLLSTDYRVDATNGIAVFSAKNDTIKYWISTEIINKED